MDGDHHIEKTAAVQERVIKEVYAACATAGVLLEGTLLKPSMTVCGAECPDQADYKKVAGYNQNITTFSSCCCCWNQLLIRWSE